MTFADRFTRRGVLAFAAGASVNRLFAASDFWNKKDPADWTRDEIDRLTTNSPWAKEVSASFAGNQPAPRPGNSGGSPRIGLGIPGIGFPGGGYPGGGRGGAGRRGETYPVKGVILWESAQPILDALKPEFPDGYAGHYVINVSGFPWPPDNDDDALDHLKTVTYLQPSRGKSVQPGVVQKPFSSGPGGILFGFSKELLDLSADDKDVLFTTRLGSTPIQARFLLKEMTYRGKLAV